MSACALLLSPDDQAVSAITGVLEELSVSCERPLDGVSAAQKLNSQSFDLVLVDCDNLPAAKLIFDVCRRSRAGTSIPIAIVDGRAGLPTAFRLGAELILTKPVAKDQARSTIRTAVSRLKKEEPARAAQPVEPASAEAAVPAVPEKLALAAAAAGSESSQAKTVSSQAKTAEASAPVAPPMAAAAAEPIMFEPLLPEAVTPKPVIPKSVTPKMNSAATAAVVAPAEVNPAPAPSPTKSSATITTASATVGGSPSSTPAPAQRPSDDPVLAELDRIETEPKPAIFSSYVKPQPSEKKGHGLLVAALLLGLAGGGFYAAWMYQPGFRGLVQVQLGRVMALAGTANQLMSSEAHPQTVSRPPTKASTPQRPPVVPTVSASSPQQTAADASTPARTPAEHTVVPAAAAATAAPEKTDLAGANDTVVLSSKGAERRLIHRVQPANSPEVRSQGIEGTVILRATVNESGAVEGVRLVEGNPALADPAISAVKQWRYKPYLRDGKARPFQTIVLVDVP